MCNRGFASSELLLVIVLIGALAGIVSAILGGSLIPLIVFISPFILLPAFVIVSDLITRSRAGPAAPDHEDAEAGP